MKSAETETVLAESDVSNTAQDETYPEIYDDNEVLYDVGFVKVGESDQAYLVSQNSLNGLYTTSDGIVDGDITYSIRVDFDDVYFEIHENGENKALSSVKSINELYIVDLFADGVQLTYAGSITGNDEHVYNTIKVEYLTDVLANCKRLTAVIYNSNAVYFLQGMDVSPTKTLLYDDSKTSQARTCMENKEYAEALALLDSLQKEDKESYDFYNAEELRAEIKENAYQEAFALYVGGKCEEALPILKLCVQTDDVITMIAECRKAIYGYEVGDIIRFGKHDTEWIVLETDYTNNKMLVISRYTLGKKPYDAHSTSGFWEECSLREYLNSEGMGSFIETYLTEDIVSKILTTTVYNGTKTERYVIKTDCYSEDKIFLLNAEQAKKYFSTQNERIVRDYIGTINSWWLISTSSNSEYVDSNGEIQERTFLSYDDKYERNASLGVRPAMWIMIEGIDS